MKFAICNETFRNHDFAGTCAEAERHGYTGLEVAPFTLGNIDKIDEKYASSLGGVIRDHGLEMVGFHWLLARTQGIHLTNPDPKVAKRTFEYTQHLIDVCSAMGGKLLVWGSPDQRTVDPAWGAIGEAKKRVIDFFQRLTPHLADSNVKVALEFLGENETNFLNTAAETIVFLKELDSPQVRLHLDVKAMSTDQRPIYDVVRESLDWAVHVHGNDPNLAGPGMGEVRFPQIADALVKGGYKGWVSVEVFDTNLEPDYLASESIKNLRSAFSR
jgi:sugar phosphate isomerase/epimerase